MAVMSALASGGMADLSRVRGVGSLGERWRAEHEAVAILVHAALQVECAARDHGAVAVAPAHAVERFTEPRAPAGFALVEQRALLGGAMREVGEREPDRVQRDAAGEEAAGGCQRHLEAYRGHRRRRLRRARLISDSPSL